jgi:hypothetical protein
MLGESVAEESFKEFCDMRRETDTSIGCWVSFRFTPALVDRLYEHIMPVGGISLCEPHLLEEEGECSVESRTSCLHHAICYAVGPGTFVRGSSFKMFDDFLLVGSVTAIWIYRLTQGIQGSEFLFYGVGLDFIVRGGVVVSAMMT